MDRNQAIGIFDSGVGGLSVVRQLISELPNEAIIYFADSARAPYGQKEAEEVIRFSTEITEFMMARHVKMLVVACNTATGIAISHLRNNFPIQFVGMEPAIKPAAKASVTRKIGVLATENTFEANHFIQTKSRYANDVDVFMTIGEGLVELIERGQANSEKALILLKQYLLPMLDQGIDQLVLGCTHYPLLLPNILKIIPPDIQIHDSVPAVVRQVGRVLKQEGGLNQGSGDPDYKFYSSGDNTILDQMVNEIIPGIKK